DTHVWGEIDLSLADCSQPLRSHLAQSGAVALDFDMPMAGCYGFVLRELPLALYASASPAGLLPSSEPVQGRRRVDSGSLRTVRSASTLAVRDPAKQATP